MSIHFMRALVLSYFPCPCVAARRNFACMADYHHHATEMHQTIFSSTPHLISSTTVYHDDDDKAPSAFACANG
jgi:hypothetical protein